MLAQILAATLLVSLGQNPPGSSKDTPPPSRKPTTQPADQKEEKPEKKGAQEAKHRPVPKDRAVKALNMVIEDATFEDLTFEDFVEWLGRTTEANVVVRWKVLDKAGIERDRPITVKEKHIKLRKLLPVVFAQVTADMRSVELAAKADGNTLMISTKQDLNTKLITRVYDVQDLLLSIPDFSGSEPGTPGRLHREGYRLKDGQGAVSKGGSEKDKSDEVVDQLISVITTNIQPLSWKVNGGKGTVTFYKGRLVVHNNIEVHEQLAGYVGATEEEEKEPAGKE